MGEKVLNKWRDMSMWREGMGISSGSSVPIADWIKLTGRIITIIKGPLVSTILWNMNYKDWEESK